MATIKAFAAATNKGDMKAMEAACSCLISRRGPVPGENQGA